MQPGSVSQNGSVSESASGSLAQIGGSLLLSLLALGVIGYATFEAAAFHQMLIHVNPWLLVAAVGMVTARIGLGGWRLSYVSHGRLDLAGGTRGQLAWYFFSNISPTIMGGGPVAALYTARDEHIPVGESAAFMLFCMLLNQLWFLVAIPVVIGAGFFVDVLPEGAGSWGQGSLLLCFGGLFLWGLIFAYLTLAQPRLLVEIVDWCLQWPLLRRFRSRGMQEMRSYFRKAKRLGTQSVGFYGRAFLLTALMWLTRYALVFFLVRSFYAVDSLLLFLRSAALLLVGLVMPTPGGSGGIEGLYALFLGPLMPTSLMAPTLLLWRTLDFYLFIALGAYLFLHYVHVFRQ